MLSKIFIARLGGNNWKQGAVSSGHERMHRSVYQTVPNPDGLIIHLFRPVEDMHLAASLYRKSGLDENLSKNCLVDHELYYIYGDQLYVL